MSKRKKIFHKPEEGIPSADDILNYLGEETTIALPKKSSSPNNNLSDKKNRKESEESFMEEEVSSIDPEQDQLRSAPAVSFEGSSKSKRNENISATKNKKKHNLEKIMLSDSLVSDAVEGYALITNKKIALTYVDTINQAIAGQSRRKNNNVASMKIAAIFLVVCLISGGSFYFFSQLNDKILADINSETIHKATINQTDTTFFGKDSIPKLAIETKDVNGNLQVDKKSVDLNKSLTTDGGYLPIQQNGAPVLDPQESLSSEKETKVSKPAIEKIESSERGIFRAEELQNPNFSLQEKDQEIVNRKQVDSKQDDLAEDNIIAPSKVSKKEASKNKKQYAPSSMGNSKGMADQVEPPVDKSVSSLKEGIALFKKRKFSEAKMVFSGLMQEDPIDSDLLFYIGMCDYNLKLYSESLINLSKISAPSSHYFEAKWHMSLIYEEKGEKQKAIALWEELSKTSTIYSNKAIKKLKE